MRRRLATIAVLLLCAAAASGAAQEPADAPSPQLMEVYQVTPGAEGAAGRAEARRQIEALRAELRRLASRQAQSSRDVASARGRLQMLNVRETALTAELGRDRNRLARLLGALQLFRREPPPALLVSPQDARDAVRAAILIRAMTPALERRAKAYGAEAREIAGLRRQAAQAGEALFTSEILAPDRPQQGPGTAIGAGRSDRSSPVRRRHTQRRPGRGRFFPDRGGRDGDKSGSRVG